MVREKSENTDDYVHFSSCLKIDKRLILNGYGRQFKNAKAILYSPFIENPIQNGKCIEFDFEFPNHLGVFSLDIFYKSTKKGIFRFVCFFFEN